MAINLAPINENLDQTVDDLGIEEFTSFERSSINKDNIRSKLDLGYSTSNYRLSLIPKVKCQDILMKKNL